MNREQAKEVLQRFRMGLCTPEEMAAIGRWYDSMSESGQWSWTEEEKQAFEASLRAGIRQKMHEHAGEDGGFFPSDDKLEELQQPYGERMDKGVHRMRSIRLSRLAAAAVIMTFVVTGAWFFLVSKPRMQFARNAAGDQFTNDVLPGGNKAILTLADGSNLVLDSAKNGLIGQQGNSRVTKLDNGKLTYQPADNRSSVVAVSYNKLSTPRGGQYQLVLPDGSRAWLNAASSIRYPTVFSGKERRVEISGEIYFEVEQSIPGKSPGEQGHGNIPFIVSIVSPAGVPGAGGEVEVLGTHFNVNAYGDEDRVMTTLLEGAVKLVKGGEHILLKPGQQGVYGRSGGPVLNKDGDADEAMAWKNGVFQFNEASIETVMRQVERWYDIEVSYEGSIPSGHFSGTVDRNANISQVLKILELSDVHFRIEGRRIVILPS